MNGGGGFYDGKIEIIELGAGGEIVEELEGDGDTIRLSVWVITLRVTVVPCSKKLTRVNANDHIYHSSFWCKFRIFLA